MAATNPAPWRRCIPAASATQAVGRSQEPWQAHPPPSSCFSFQESATLPQSRSFSCGVGAPRRAPAAAGICPSRPGEHPPTGVPPGWAPYQQHGCVVHAEPVEGVAEPGEVRLAPHRPVGRLHAQLFYTRQPVPFTFRGRLSQDKHISGAHFCGVEDAI